MITPKSKKEAETLSKEIGSKVRVICDKAIQEANQVLFPYGLISKMQIAINEIGKIDDLNQSVKSSKKKKR